jgi:phosphoserine phosphatase
MTRQRLQCGRAQIRRLAAPLLALTLVVGVRPLAAQDDPLPSWKAGPVKTRLLEFVRRVTSTAMPDSVPPAARVATFDNDGTLWAEQPMYVQLAFTVDRVRALAPQHPEWKDTQPFKGVLEGDLGAVAATGERGAMELIAATHAGLTTDGFERVVRDWLGQARHPRFQRPYTEIVCQPMLELLADLRANGFNTFIVSGGGIEFMRPWAERVYGVPPEQVIGSSLKTRFEMRESGPVLVKLATIDFVDDKDAKPAGIQRFIGRRPIATFGNSDGDLQMLQWTAAGSGPRLMALIHHTDSEREWAYDRQSSIGRLDRALDEARARGWVVVDMKRDWKGLMGYRTPNVDRLAKEGMKFTDAYGEQSCTAGRASFITGQSGYRTAFLETFKELPPRQRAASFTVDQAPEKMAEPMRKAA